MVSPASPITPMSQSNSPSPAAFSPSPAAFSPPHPLSFSPQPQQSQTPASPQQLFSPNTFSPLIFSPQVASQPPRNQADELFAIGGPAVLMPHEIREFDPLNPLADLTEPQPVLVLSSAPDMMPRHSPLLATVPNIFIPTPVAESRQPVPPGRLQPMTDIVTPPSTADRSILDAFIEGDAPDRATFGSDGWVRGFEYYVQMACNPFNNSVIVGAGTDVSCIAGMLVKYTQAYPAKTPAGEVIEIKLWYDIIERLEAPHDMHAINIMQIVKGTCAEDLLVQFGRDPPAKTLRLLMYVCLNRTNWARARCLVLRRLLAKERNGISTRVVLAAVLNPATIGTARNVLLRSESSEYAWRQAHRALGTRCGSMGALTHVATINYLIDNVFGDCTCTEKSVKSCTSKPHVTCDRFIMMLTMRSLAGLLNQTDPKQFRRSKRVLRSVADILWKLETRGLAKKCYRQHGFWRAYKAVNSRAQHVERQLRAVASSVKAAQDALL